MRTMGVGFLTALLLSVGCWAADAAKGADLSKPKAFVGSAKCAECHEKVHDNWTGTLHAVAFQDAKKDPSVILGDFTTPNELRNFTPADVSYVHGVQWKQRYIDKDWHILQAQWNFDEKAWTKAPSFGKVEKTDWRKSCGHCHTVGFDPAKLTWKEIGVGCESCHGAGSHHSEATQEQRPGTIVNPAKLPPGRAAAVCGQCHTRGTSPDGKFEYPIGYQVGMDLGPQHFTVAPSTDEKAWWPSRTVKQHRQQYPMWLESRHMKAGVTCETCHSVHEHKSKYATKQSPNNLCIGCHANISTDAVTGHAPIAGAPQHTNCVGCHMAAVGKSAEVGDEHDHSFRVLRPSLTLTLGEGDVKKQPNSCNACHWHKDDSPESLQKALDEGAKNTLKRK